MLTEPTSSAPAPTVSVLVVEDERIVARDLCQTLQGWGYTVIGPCGDADVALELAAAYKPDLTLIDVHLDGEVDGIDTAIRLGQRRPSPVVFLTAYSSHDLIERAKQANPYGYVLKPYSDSELKTTLELALHRVRAERAWAQEEAHTRAVLDIVDHGVVTIDDHGTMEFVNQAACAMFGYRHDELLHRNVSMLMPESVAERHDGYLHRYRTTQEAHVLGMLRELDGLRKDGTLFPMALWIRRVQRNGRDVFVGTMRDLSETRHYVYELEKQRAGLEQQVAQRTAELRVAREQAEAANEAKSAFVANVSHEVRTPIHAMLGFASQLKRELTHAQVVERAQKIESAGKHLLAIVNDVLDFSKIESGHMELERIPFEWATQLDHVRAILEPLAQSKGLELQLISEGVPAWLLGDPTRLRQAWLNFAGNAIKFTARGSVTLRARGQPAPHAEPGMCLLRLEVTDTGIGIAPQDQKRLFSAFEQGSASVSREYGGTGLGLVIAQRIAALMGGEVGMHSTLGQGSTFWFTAQLPAVSPLPQVVKAQPVPTTDLGGRTILVVDDDAFSREIVADLLAQRGAQVQMAESGQQALDWLATHCPDAVLMDVQMPGMSGLQAVRRIRALDRLHDLPVIGLTAGVFESDVTECLDAGMNQVVGKPIQRNALLQALELCWRSRPAS